MPRVWLMVSGFPWLSTVKITTSESLIMDVLWRADRPLAIEDVREALTDETWTDATIRTFLSRLVKKKAVATFKDGRRFLFRAVIDRADYVHAESRSLITIMFPASRGISTNRKTGSKRHTRATATAST